jgi:hypothetical protein
VTPAGYAPAQVAATIGARLADAVAADDRALLITRSNDGAGWVPRLEVSEHHPFAVTVRDGLVGCDFDRADAGKAARWLTDQAGAAGVPCVLVASGQPGRFHVWLNVGSCAAGTLQGIVGAAKGAGADVRQVIRPPLAAHRLEGRAELLQPADPEQALAILEGAGDPAAAGRLAAAIGSPLDGEGTGNVPAGSLQNPPRLSVRARELLAAADPGTYRSRSELLRACLVALANTGTPGHVAVGLILDARTAAGDRSCVAVKAAERDARWLAAEWDRACAWVVTHPARSAAARNVAAQALEAARAIRWDRGLGVRGSSITRCLTVFLQVAFAAGRLDGLTVSRRQLVEASGLGAATAGKAVAVLLERGLIVKESGQRTAWRAQSWQVAADHPLLEHRQPEPVEHTPPPSPPDPTATGSVSRCLVGADVVPSDHPAWRVQALGPSALRVAQVLTGVPQSGVQLAGQVGLSADWVRVLLRRMVDVGLVRRVPGGFVLMSDSERLVGLLDHVADVSGAGRMAAGVVALHERERSEYSGRLAARGLAPNPKYEGLVRAATATVRRVSRVEAAGSGSVTSGNTYAPLDDDAPPSIIRSDNNDRATVEAAGSGDRVLAGLRQVWGEPSGQVGEGVPDGR